MDARAPAPRRLQGSSRPPTSTERQGFWLFRGKAPGKSATSVDLGDIDQAGRRLDGFRADVTWPGEPGASTAGGQPIRCNRQHLIPVRRPPFPVMRDLNEMIRATRYIAQRQEYLAMREARDPKKAQRLLVGLHPTMPRMDRRKLISTPCRSCSRRQRPFQRPKEGWCTDRGMVHITGWSRGPRGGGGTPSAKPRFMEKKAM